MKKFYEEWAGRPFNRETLADLFRLAKPMLLYLPFYLLWFMWVEHHRFSHYAVIHTVLDDRIPFIEVFVIPYYIWFVYVTATVVFLLFSFEIEDCYKNFFFLATGMTIFLIISTLFPNMHQLRPMAMPRDNVFTHLVQLIYATDTPANLWPSIHVYNSIGSMIAIQHSKRVNWVGKIIGHIIGVSIILSTVFIKQHSVYDVLTAFIMAIVFYYVFYHTSLVENYCKKREESVAVRLNN